MVYNIYWRRLIVSLSIGSFFYICFYFIFYKFLGKMSVEGLIGVSMLFLFCAIYKYGGFYINRFFVSISKNILFYFLNLISLTYLVENLFIKTIDSSKKLMVFQFISNHLVFSEIQGVFNDLNALLLNKYILNVVLSELFFKRLVIKNLLDKSTVINEVIVLDNNFLLFDAFALNNVLGWFK